MGSQSKQIVHDYLLQKGITPNPAGALYEDLIEDNEAGLEYLAYAITNYRLLRGVEANISALASIPVTDFDKEREYDNRLTEFMGLWFVSDILKQRIVALEAQSPHRAAGSNKTCDLQSDAEVGAIFYEVKDFSSEILTQQQVDEGITTFNPGLPHKIKPWIEGYVQNCVQKGANYLVCRVPAWHVRKRPKLTADWVKRIYPNFSPIGAHSFSVAHGLTLPASFRGVYVIRRDEHLFMGYGGTA
jgi:hypothetical protein